MNNVDKYTKVVLTVIALALSVIALNPWLEAVLPTYPQDYILMHIESAVDDINDNLRKIHMRLCLNPKIY